MTAARKPETEPGTAVTTEQRREQKRAEIMGSLPDSVKHQLALRQMSNAVASEIAGMSWGQNIGRETARALAEWGRRYNVDVTQEIDILGNRVYLNSRYYLRRLSELVDAELVEWAYPDHINADERLLQLGEEGKREAERRLTERIRYNAPEKAAAIVVFRVKLKALTQETVGVNWAGGGVRKSDPVGDTEPVKTAESRAARRCMRQLVSHVPALAEDVESVISTLPHLEEQIQLDHAQVAPTALPSVREDGYEPETRAARTEVKAEVKHMGEAKSYGKLPADPYLTPEQQREQELAEDAELARRDVEREGRA